LGSAVLTIENQDCSCLKIVTVEPTLTTIILKKAGLAFGADYINQKAKEHATKVQNDTKAHIQGTFSSNLGFRIAEKRWWKDFEDIYKRDLQRAKRSGFLQTINGIEIPGLFEVVERASEELALFTKMLIEQITGDIKDMLGLSLTVSLPLHLSIIYTNPKLSIRCFGGYSQSPELRKELATWSPKPCFELSNSEYVLARSSVIY
jgi:hypothetical protein